jgi:hypothetical protein
MPLRHTVRGQNIWPFYPLMQVCDGFAQHYIANIFPGHSWEIVELKIENDRVVEGMARALLRVLVATI